MACRNFVQNAWNSTLSKGGHDANVFSNLKLVSAKPGYLKALLPVEKRHLNNHQTVHGGVLLSLTDTMTSLALATMGLTSPTGVSVNISTEFVRPGGREGEELIGIGEVVKIGRTLAYTRVTFYTPDDKVVAYGSHTKHMAKSKQVTAFSKDGQEEIPLDPAQAKL